MTHWLPKFTIIPANKVKNMPNCKLTVGGGEPYGPIILIFLNVLILNNILKVALSN